MARVACGGAGGRGRRGRVRRTCGPAPGQACLERGGKCGQSSSPLRSMSANRAMTTCDPQNWVLSPWRKFSQEIQLHQAPKRPNFSLHSSLLGLSETPLRRCPHSSPSCSLGCSVRCSPHRSDRYDLSRSRRCSPGCRPGCGRSRSSRYSLRCSARCSPGRSGRCGPSHCPRSSPRSSDHCSHDCSENRSQDCLRSCLLSCSVNYSPG
jgi:hypothetical protein